MQCVDFCVILCWGFRMPPAERSPHLSLSKDEGEATVVCTSLYVANKEFHKGVIIPRSIKSHSSDYDLCYEDT